MRRCIFWGVTAAAAGLIQHYLGLWLADLPANWIVMWGGGAALLWARLLAEPLDRWASAKGKTE